MRGSGGVLLRATKWADQLATKPRRAPRRCAFMKMVHLTARVVRGQRPFATAGAAQWLWERLRRMFPNALAACLMPDHLHLVAMVKDPAKARKRLARLLGAFTRYRAPDVHWSVAKPSEIPNGAHLLRQIRYVHLNPCRDGLTDDPLSWRYSTHRGLIGAELDPWVTPERLAPLVGRAVEGFAEWIHAYVSGDPTVSQNGTPFPAAAEGRDVPREPLDKIVQAAWSATPWSKSSTRRAVAVQLAKHQGWRDTTLMGRALNITAQAVRQATTRASRVALAAAALCLGDERLLGSRMRRDTRPIAAE